MKQLFNNSFLKSISILISGSIVAQIISFVVSPVMTRLYSSEEIGLYTLIITGVTMFGSVICGRYDMAIVAEKNEENVFSLIKLSFIISLVVSLIISVGYLFYYNKTTISASVVSITMFVLLFSTGIRNILVSYNNRNKQYALMTSVYVLRTVIKDISLVILGIFKAGSLGLLLSQILGEIFGLNRQAKELKRHIKTIISQGWMEIKQVSKSHYKQPLYSVPALFANNFSYASINLFIENLFGLAVLGHYYLTYKILGLPLTVISGNISKVFFQEASREYDKFGSYKKAFLKTTLILTLIALPMAAFMFFLAPSVFKLIFGDGWEISGYYVKLLAPMFAIRFIVTALSPGLIISNKQKIELIINCIFVLTSIIIFLLSKEFILNVNQYLGLICLFYSIIYTITLVILIKNAIKKEVIN